MPTSDSNEREATPPLTLLTALLSAVSDILAAGAYDGDEFICSHEDATALSDAYIQYIQARGES